MRLKSRVLRVAALPPGVDCSEPESPPSRRVLIVTTRAEPPLLLPETAVKAECAGTEALVLGCCGPELRSDVRETRKPCWQLVGR